MSGTYYGDRPALDVALQLLEKGYNPLPCGNPTGPKTFAGLDAGGRSKLKVPHGFAKGELEAKVFNTSPTPETVRGLTWPAYLVGVQARDVLVIDLDTKHGDSFVQAEEACQFNLPHWATQTTMSGGRQFFARLPDGVKATNGIVTWNGNRVGETRAGNAYACVYEPDRLLAVADLPEFDPDELPEGLVLTNAGMGAIVGATRPATSKTPVDGALGLLEAMVTAQAPESSRHESIFAVLNIAYRLGVLDGALDIISSDAVRDLWCADRSRDARDWSNEIERGAKSVREKGGKGYGLPFLERQGFAVSEIASVLREIVPNEAAWTERQPLPPERPSAPSLPSEMIPEPFRAWLEDAAERARQPLESIAIPAIVAASGVIGRTVRIKPRAFSDWPVTPNLWGAIVAPPGTMKSDLIGEAVRPISRLEAKARDAYQLAKLEADAERDVLEAQVSAARSKAKKDRDGAKSDLLDLKGKLDALDAVPERRYSTQNATVEKLGELLRDNPRGMILIRDELAPWIASLEAEDAAESRGFFLTAWNGSSGYTFDRIGRGTVYIPAACVTVLGGIQPGPLQAVFDRLRADPTRADGMLQRFQLLVWPDGLPEWVAPTRWPGASARDRAFAVFERLDTLEFRAPDSGDIEPHTLEFSPEASALFSTWHDALENRLRGKDGHGSEFDGFPHFHSHLSKYRSLAPSLAVVFHLIELAGCEAFGGFGGGIEAVTAESLELALNWVDYLEIHARKVYAAELSAQALAANTVAKRIKAGTLRDGMTVRDARRAEWSGLTDGRLEVGLRALESLGWLRVEEKDTGGRPSEVIRLHPDLVRSEAVRA